MNVSIVGTGYVGLVSGACLAEKGHRVICVDVSPERVSSLNRAEAPIFEAGLEDLLKRHVGSRLSATTDLTAAVLGSELTLIAVGTPFQRGEIDLTAVLTAATQIGSVLQQKSDYHVVVVKSTVVPGTTDTRVLPALEAASRKTAGPDFGIGMNPEFLSEGEAISDFLMPDRIVLGGIDDRTLSVLVRLYAPFTDVPVIKTNTRTAEMIKYASNALLATLISFSNEMANLGSAVGEIDAVDVIHGVHLSQYFRVRESDNRPAITSFLRPGCGFGGSCLPKDVNALIAHGRSLGERMRLLEAVIQINKEQPQKVIGLLRRHYPRLQGRRVAVLGLSFKPETSDVRESPAFPIMRELLRLGTVLTAYDPVAIDEARVALSDPMLTYCSDLTETIAGVDAVILVTPWKEFDSLPGLLKGRPVVLVDCRRALDKQSYVEYQGIGL